MIIIGDVHGKVNKYYKILQKNQNIQSICVGDFGFKKSWDWLIEAKINPEYNKINMGNHDYLPYLNTSKHSLGNFTYNDDIFTVRGANSVDRHLRTEGKDWFRDEEMNYAEFNECIDLYEKVKPKIVVSHNCPYYILNELFGIWDKSITVQGLQTMLEIHQPDLWIFGHHHKKHNELIDRTRFICLPELEVFNL